MSIDKAKGRRGIWRWNKATGEFEQVDKPKPLTLAPAVITDEIPPTMSMTGTDKVYTSKSALRREYKEMGFVETGGELHQGKPVDKEAHRREIRETVMKAMNDARYGMAPLTERDKELHLREKRAWESK
jgi:hypothetical protein